MGAGRYIQDERSWCVAVAIELTLSCKYNTILPQHWPCPDETVIATLSDEDSHLKMIVADTHRVDNRLCCNDDVAVLRLATIQ